MLFILPVVSVGKHSQDNKRLCQTIRSRETIRGPRDNKESETIAYKLAITKQ